MANWGIHLSKKVYFFTIFIAPSVPFFLPLWYNEIYVNQMIYWITYWLSYLFYESSIQWSELRRFVRIFEYTLHVSILIGY